MTGIMTKKREQSTVLVAVDYYGQYHYKLIDDERERARPQSCILALVDGRWVVVGWSRHAVGSPYFGFQPATSLNPSLRAHAINARRNSGATRLKLSWMIAPVSYARVTEGS